MGSGKTPQGWRRANVMPLHSKLASWNCQNYILGMSLISVLEKVYAKVVNERVNRQISGKIMEISRSYLYISTLYTYVCLSCLTYVEFLPHRGRAVVRVVVLLSE